MHLHFEKTVNARSDCSILSLTWMGKVPDELPEDEGWKLNRTNYYQEGWLATGNIRGIVGVTFTTSHCKKNVDFPLRTNYNLRGHRSEVILVKWNEPYQKLASCDSSGIIFVWIKYEGRWSIELINDRNTPVTHFSWSHDGRMALICYQDGFVLVGSVAGQRYWSSMLNLEATITCGIWTPDDQQVYFGTNTGQIIVMDVHGAMVSQVQLTADVGIASMAWSCEKFKMEEGDDNNTDQTSYLSSYPTSEKKFVLAVGLQNGYIYLLKTFDDVSPVQVDTQMQGPICMEWSNSRELLAVAGVSSKSNLNRHQHHQNNVDDHHNQHHHEANEEDVLNQLKFYNERGALLYVVTIPNGQGGGVGGGDGPVGGPVTAMTWGHNDKRLFVATGTQIHIAWISRRIATLQLLCRLQIHGSIRNDTHVSKLPLPPRIRNLIGNLFAQTIRCCVPGPSALREFVSRPPNGSIRLHCTMIRHDEDSTSASTGTCYTLYLEYLGGLVPLLKGKRTSKIRPEFVIFDPQMEDEDLLVFDASYSAAPPLSPPPSPAPAMQQQQSSSSATFLQWSPDSKSSGSSSQSTSGGNLASDSSDSDRDEGGGGCAASPRMQRRRKRRNKYQRLPSEKQSGGGGVGGGGRSSSGDAGDLEDLAYVDTLPEWYKQQVRRVEVTSSIWGTKFKIHGLVDSVPANLGQVTYKTSLLHLQPRQMTLVMTELRDDFPVGPDPNFNPNLFSEDEEDLIQLEEKARIQITSPVIDNSPPIAPMSPLNGRFTRSSKATTIASTTTTDHPISKSPIPALAKAESYEDEFPYVELTRTSAINNNHLHHNQLFLQNTSIATTTTSTTTTSFVGVGSQRHAISPLYCDGSVVPTLQSPKNAVAPSDIIFERPPAQTLISDYQNGVQSMKTSFLNDYNHHHHHHHHHHLHHHLRNSSSSSTSSAQPSDTTNTKSLLRKLNTGSVESSARRKDKQKPFVEEEAAAGPSTNATRPMLIGDSMVRSCSVGYLDMVDEAHPTVSNEVALLILRKDVPKRLVLVNRKKQQQLHQHSSNNHQQQHQRRQQQQRRYQSNTKPPDLKTCGKSKSLDSSDIFPASSSKPSIEERTRRTIEEHIHPPTSPSATPATSTNTVTTAAAIITNTTTTTTTTKKESKLSFFVSKSPLMRRKKSAQTTEEDGKQKSRSRSKEKSKCKKNGYEVGGGGLSLHTHALVTLENLLTRLREESGKPATSASSSASPRLPKSSPASPAPCKKGKRPQSASPIRKHILSSPLLGGRRFKKNRLLESSDDEVTDTGGSGGDDVCNGTNYRNLETFQKAQLRQKLKRGNGNGNQSVTAAATTSSSSSSSSSSTSSSTTVTMVQQQQSQRREFVMHNKAPMWNENSQVYQLDFGGRVTQESAKNFQIEFKGGKQASNNKSTEIVMQFGRIDGNAYTLDFQYPFSALQAFAVALANVTQRLK